MRKLLVAMFVALLMVGCGEDSEYSEWAKPTEQSQTPGTMLYGMMKKLFDDYSKRAVKGDVNAQLNLVWHYENGEGVPRDYVTAYAWQLIAQGNEGIEIYPGNKQDLGKLAQKMTSNQIAKGQELSKELLKKIEANKKADKPEDSSESNQTSVAPLETNQSSAETPEAKTAEVAKVVVDGDDIELRDGLPHSRPKVRSTPPICKRFSFVRFNSPYSPFRGSF